MQPGHHSETAQSHLQSAHLPRYLRSPTWLEGEGLDEAILELWENACGWLCEGDVPPTPVEALAVLDLLARDASRLVNEQMSDLLVDNVATATQLGEALGMSRQAVVKRVSTWQKRSG